MVGQPSREKVHNYQIYQKYIIFNKNFFNVNAKALMLEKVERKFHKKRSLYHKKEVQINLVKINEFSFKYILKIKYRVQKQ